MVYIRGPKDEQKYIGSPRGEVGEIDTRAPFQSVKAAVSLFGEASVSNAKRSVRKKSSENVLEKETQFLLAQRELNKIKQKMESAETTRAKSCAELEKARMTLNDLTNKLKAVSESKHSAIEASEAVKNRAKELEEAKSKKAIGFESWKRELDSARREYITTVRELDVSKQELNKIRQDFDDALEAKQTAFQMGGEAQRSAKVNTEKIFEFSKEISSMKESITHLKQATERAQEEKEKIIEENASRGERHLSAKEEIEKRKMSLKEELDLEQMQNLQLKLARTSEEIEVLQEEIEKLHASEMDTVKAITSEINEATKALEEVTEEEASLRKIVASLTEELESMKREKEGVKESLADGVMNSSGQDGPGSMEMTETQSPNDMAYHQLSAESENAKWEAEKMNRKAEELKQEAEAARDTIEEAERRLELALKELEECRAAEKRALDEMRILSQRQETDDASNSESCSKIKLSIEEFESFSSKIQESADVADKTEAECMAQVKAINLRKKEVDKKIEANLKAIEEIKIATEIALKNADAAESARMMAEGELSRRRQQELTEATESSSNILGFYSTPNSWI